MATILLAAVADSIGANAFWTAVLTSIGGYIDSQIFGPKMNAEGPRMNDLHLQTSTFGAPINQVYGTCRIAGNVIWGTNYVEHEKKKSQGGGKGGGGGSVTTTTYTYSVSFALALCEGPINGIGRVWADGKLIDASKLGTYTLYYGNESQNPDPYMEGIEGAGNVPAYRGLAYIVFQDFYVTDYGNRIPNLSVEVTRPITNLKDIVEEISGKAGLNIVGDTSDVDASDLSDINVPGFVTSGEKTFRERIEQLMLIYLFDGIEKNGKVVFKKRRIGEVIPIGMADLGAYESQRPADLYKITRKHDRELPKKLTVNYLSADKDYQQGTMSAVRQITTSQNETTVELTFVLNDAWAKTLADTRLFEAWLQRSTIEIQVGPKFGFLTPGDVVELDLGDRKRLALVTKTTWGKPGINKVTATDIGGTTYLTVDRPVDPDVIQTPASPASAVTIEFLDLPKLPWDTSATDDGIYLAATGASYYGANILRTDDGGTTWSLAVYDAGNATMGTTLSALAAGPTNFWDNGNTVDVVLTHGTLENRPAVDVLNGFNAALIGNEIVQFKGASLIAADTYRLSGLLRGRLGTEDQITSHTTGERFVLLNSSTIGKLTVPTSDWYVTRTYRVGPSTLPADDPKYQEHPFTSQGRMALPLSPCHIKGTRDASGNLTITWKRRTRADGSWKNYVDVPLGESIEAYDVEIITSGTVKRTIRTTTPSAAYAASDQVADFGSAQSAITVKIYQISETRGRGLPKEGIV